MSTGPILVLAKPPKSRTARSLTSPYNEHPTFSLSADPKWQTFTPWVLQEMSPAQSILPNLGRQIVVGVSGGRPLVNCALMMAPDTRPRR